MVKIMPFKDKTVLFLKLLETKPRQLFEIKYLKKIEISLLANKLASTECLVRVFTFIQA